MMNPVQGSFGSVVDMYLYSSQDPSGLNSPFRINSFVSFFKDNCPKFLWSVKAASPLAEANRKKSSNVYKFNTLKVVRVLVSI